MQMQAAGYSPYPTNPNFGFAICTHNFSITTIDLTTKKCKNEIA